MLRVVIGFFRGILSLPRPWWVWIGLLMAVNMIAPLFFLGTLEARIVLVAFFVAAGIQMAIFGAKGFVRLLGVGHLIPWVPLCLWLWTRLEALGTSTPLGQWLASVIILDGISLLIDAVDVFRYARGDRTPSVKT